MDFDDEFDDEFLDDLALVQALDQVENGNQMMAESRPVVHRNLATIPPKSVTSIPMVNKKYTIAGTKQQTLFDHFQLSTSNLQNKQQNLQNQKKILFDPHHLGGTGVQSKPRAVNPKRPDAIKSYHAIDKEALKTWIYPINYPIRDYQFNISQSALFSNTFVCLPTGLGKTFIAAVVIYNYLRWFPEGCVIFSAPTKPLVTQQVEACKKITGIGDDLIAELTGSKSAETRRISWSKQRLFFMTPETFRNDIQSNNCDVDKIVLVIFDEAHRASGQYAYCEIIKALEREKAVFRVLALSATPANDPKKVQGVIENLYIEKLQLRTEDSFDVRPYIFEKKIDEIVMPPSELMDLILQKFLPFLDAPVKKLNQQHCINQLNPATISSYYIHKARETWRLRNQALPQSVKGMIEGHFALAHTLSIFRENLFSYGIRFFYDALHTFAQEIKQKSNSSRSKLEIVKNPNFISLMQFMECKMEEKDFSSHPKLEKLVETVVEHFKAHETQVRDAIERGDVDIQNETKVMIFSSLRSSVVEICNLLKKHSPLVRPSSFVGQATSGKNNVGMKQKEQLMLMEDFRNGLYNVIISTSIGEEGLDIGELDLIICFDNKKSPIRMLQRCGRTGRKRKGKICLLVNQGAEEEAVKKAKSQYKAVQTSIIDGNRLEMYPGSLAAVLPDDCEPQCAKEALVVPEENPTTRKSSKTLLLNAAQLEDYMMKNMISFDNVPKLDLSAQTHWQTNHLPIYKVAHSSLADMYVRLMEYASELKIEEEKNMPEYTQKDESFPSSGYQNISLPPLPVQKRKSKFQFDDLPGNNSDDSDNFLTKDIASKKKPRKGIHLSSSSSSIREVVVTSNPACTRELGSLLSDPSFRSSPFEVIQKNGQSSEIDEVIPPSPILFKSQTHPENPSDVEFNVNSPKLDIDAFGESRTFSSKIVDPIFAEEEACDDEAQFDFAARPASYEKSNEEEVDIFSDLDLDLSFDDDGSNDWKAIFDAVNAAEANYQNDSSLQNDHVFLKPSGKPFEIPARVLIPPTPVALSLNNPNQSSSSIVVQRKRSRVVLDSSSASQPVIFTDAAVIPSKTPLITRIERRKQMKRLPPRERGTPQLPLAKEGRARKPKRPKNKISEGLVDVEVEVSSGGEYSSDEEGSWLDQDLSGFIASEDPDEEAQIDRGVLPTFYRESLMDDNIPKYGNKYKLSRGIALRRPVGSAGHGLAGSSENDSIHSLEDFICPDDDVEFEEKEGDSILDWTQAPKKRNRHSSSSRPSSVEKDQDDIVEEENIIEIDF